MAEDAARAYDQKLVELHGATGWLGGVCGLVGWVGSGVQVVVLFVRLVVPDRVVWLLTQLIQPSVPAIAPVVSRHG